MNSAAQVRAGDNVRENTKVPTVGFFMWMRFPSPCHTRSGADCHTQGTAQGDITDPALTLHKSSPGKRKPVIFL